jgi:hypothetical protein
MTSKKSIEIERDSLMFLTRFYNMVIFSSWINMQGIRFDSQGTLPYDEKKIEIYTKN